MKKKNYHTHTARCMHAVGTDEEFILAAIEAGYTVIGFSDHSPWHYNSDFVSHMRMHESEFDEYYHSIKALKEKYKDQIEVFIALECEYFPQYMDWLKKLVEDYQLDYIILGNHYYQTDELRLYFGRKCREDDFFMKYIDSCIEGMKTGMYACLAHPDLFMRGRDQFDELAREQSYRLCRAAKELNIPIEYNLAGVQTNDLTGQDGYPYDEFWKIAVEVGNDIIIGVDAHEPLCFTDTQYFDDSYAKLKAMGAKLVDKIDTKHYAK